MTSLLTRLIPSSVINLHTSWGVAKEADFRERGSVLDDLALNAYYRS